PVEAGARVVGLRDQQPTHKTSTGRHLNGRAAVDDGECPPAIPPPQPPPPHRARERQPAAWAPPDRPLLTPSDPRSAVARGGISPEKMDKSSALEYINQMFPTEASLSGVEPLMQKIQSEIRRVDASILAAVRQQSNSGTKAKEELAAATNAVQELMHKIHEIKTKAEQSETMVQEICRDIKKLDCAKRHITTTITALHRLTMLVSAVEQLQVMASKRQYKEAAAQLEAVNQLCSHFEAYRDVPKITELREKFKNIKKILKSHVFSDFSSLGTGKETEDSMLLQQLSDACLVVDALEPSAFQRTLEFEEELAEKFSGGTAGARNKESGSDDEDEGTERNKIVSDIRKKYEKKLAVPNDEIEQDKDKQKDLSVPGAGFNFHGIISSCFEPYMSVYIELEEKSLSDQLDKLVQEERWEIEEGSQTNILSSSMQVFQKILKTYANKLYARLPKGGTGIVAAATGTDGQIRTSDRDERMICYIVNTAEYCHQTAGELAENVAKMINPQFADKVDMSEVQDEFSAVITKALMTLVHGLETKFDGEMVAMTRVPWATLESVGDQSEYVNGISSILSSSIPVLGSLLSPTYFQYFLDKLAASLGPRFYLNIYKCKHISETGAQQMLLDTQAVKTILLDIPALGKQGTVAASYSKFVSREMSKAEALLKVILSPVDSVANTYRALLPEGTPLEFQRILDLKGLKKADQQAILEDFNKHAPAIKHPTVAPTVAPPVAAASVQIAPVPTPTVSITPSMASLTGALANREDVLARAAALGRGAATTGFKRFLALTEAAKDRKDGPFRKLFNP
ncbi:hypothetical protein EJB05_18033, partial [Eragrostis curvula]